MLSYHVHCELNRVGAAARPPARILLTGATGFLGAHILYYTLMETHVRLMSIVVAFTATSANAGATAAAIEPVHAGTLC
jgi:uncharacterized protein YbjT (DUF2867 family)